MSERMDRDDRPAPRRGHTRRLLIPALVGLTALVAGVVALEDAAPQVAPEVIAALAVDDLPPLGLEDVPVCTRALLEETTITELRGDFEPGDRLSSEQVHACPAAWDGKQVTFVGEAIGEVLPRRGGAWVQINDDPYALETGPLLGHRERAGFNSGLSVWLPDGLHERLDGVGRHAQRGTVVQLEGTILRADPEDGGGTTLRAESLEVLATSVELEEPFHTLQAVIAGVLALGAIGALLAARRARRR